jgi:arabinose-5-phosphate isomerase
MESIMAMTRAHGGAAVVAGADGRLEGIFTDGDFRRIMSDPAGRLPSVLSAPVSGYMTPSPMFVRDDVYAAELLKIFERKRIDDLPVCDAAGRVVGLVDIQDLPKMKVM